MAEGVGKRCLRYREKGQKNIIWEKEEYNMLEKLVVLR